MSEALSIDDFASQLAQADTPEQPIEDSGTDEQVEQESEGQPESEPEEVEAEAQAEDETEGEQDEQPEEPASSDDRVIKWTTANGEAFEVTERELRDGYMRQQDYTQKAQSIAEERKQVQQLAQQQIQEVQQFAAEIGQVQMLEATLNQYQQIDWQQLREADPVSYQEHLARFTELKQQYRDAGESLALKRQHYAQQAQAQTEQELVNKRALAEQHLVKVFPGVTQQDTQAMFKTLMDKGATPEDLKVLTTLPWAVELAMYAQKWLALQTQKPQAVKKVASVPQKAPPAQRTAPSKTEQLVKAATSKKALDLKTFASALAATSKR